MRATGGQSGLVSRQPTSTDLVDIVETRDEADRLEIPPLLIRESLGEALPGSGEVEIERVRAGHSNLTFSVTDRDARRWVLRRPPLRQVLATAHDMGREHRIISALGPTDVPVPPAVGLCTDESVNGVPFYVMDFVDGPANDVVQVYVDGDLAHTGKLANNDAWQTVRKQPAQSAPAAADY